MLTMKMFRTRVEFEWDDKEVNSTVTLSDTDTQETVLRKLKRVIALVEGELTPPPAELLERYQNKVAELTGFPSGPPTNGWAAYAEPKVPEHLAGEIEVIKPGEEA